MVSESSSASPTSTGSAPSETTTHSGSDDSSDQGLNPNSSLPFSFLITFIAIFLFFLGCGLGSRRVTRTLRRNLGLQVTGLEVERRQPRIPREKPLLWDVFPKEAPLALGGKGAEGVFSHSWEQLAVSLAHLFYVLSMLPCCISSHWVRRMYAPETLRTLETCLFWRQLPRPQRTHHPGVNLTWRFVGH